MKERNILCSMEYVGTNYSGFQRQEGVKTIEGELLRAIQRLVGYQVEISVASRTDAGVHALGQVFNFHLQSVIPTSSLKKALNGLLPSDMVILQLREVDLDLKARFQAKGKHYVYQVLNRPLPSAFLAPFALHYHHPLNLNLMAKGGKLLEGKGDFSSFEASGSVPRDPNCHLKEVRIEEKDDLLLIHVLGDRFLYKMVRIMVGTLLEIGRGKMELEDLPLILKAKDRKRAGPTAQPWGLFLKKVFFQDNCNYDEKEVFPHE